MSSKSKIISALAVVALIALSFAVVPSLATIRIPAAYAVTPQTYYLDTTSGSGACSGYLSLDYGTTPASASSVTLNPQDSATFCNPSISSTIYTFDVTLVLYISSGLTGLSFQAALNDLTTSTTQPIYVASLGLLPSSTCSSPTKLTLDMTVGASATYNVGDAIALGIENYIFSGTFSICTGGSYASYMTINPLAVTTLTSVSTSTTTATSISTTTATSTIFVYPSATHVSCFPKSPRVGQSVQCNAVVSSKSGGTPTGTVSFAYSEGRTSRSFPSVGCAPIAGYPTKCLASITLDFQKTGYATVTATYSGDLAHQPSHGATVEHVLR
jgi:hypothetical protein